MAGEKIMIIDDNRTFLEELEETLGLCGYDTEIVADSTKAISAARKAKPNVILLDLKMNGTNGFQLANELKRSKETAKIPIIAMSGYFPVERATLLDMQNTDARIKKPFSILDIITAIESVLKSNKEIKLNN